MLSIKTKISCIAIIILSQATLALAQAERDDGQHEVYHPVPPLPPEQQFSYDHASTALEGALRGKAQLTHADGSYWLSISQAMICREQARALAQANREHWVEYRIGMHKWYEHERKVHMEELRRANEAARAAKYAMYQLGPEELDRTSGSIAWPAALQTVEFDRLCFRLEALFELRFRAKTTPEATAAEVIECTRLLSEMLRRQRAGIERESYFEAQRFLCGLCYEAEFAQRPQS